MPFILETDSIVAANKIADSEQNRSLVAALVGEAKRRLALDHEHVISHMSRNRNKASHALAQMGISVPRTTVWHRHGPDEFGTICQQDCKDLR